MLVGDGTEAVIRIESGGASLQSPTFGGAPRFTNGLNRSAPCC